MTPKETKRIINSLKINNAENYSLNEIGEALDMCLSAMDEKAKGRWIDKGTYMTETEEMEMECPECGEEVTTTQGYYRYCPWCGEKIGG